MTGDNKTLGVAGYLKAPVSHIDKSAFLSVTRLAGRRAHLE